MTTRERAEASGARVLATVRSSAHGQVAGPETSLQIQPANAISAALDMHGWTAADLDLVEINEALAEVVAASGARLAVHAARELARRGTGRAAVAHYGGQGEALLEA